MEKRHIESGINDPKIISVISYLTLVGWLISYLLNNPKSEQASFHIRQALGVNLIFVVSGLCFVVPLLGWVAGIVGYVLGAALWVLGFLYAFQEEDTELPYIGRYFQEWFQGV